MTKRLLDRVTEGVIVALDVLGMHLLSPLENLETATNRVSRRVVRAMVATTFGRDNVAIKVVLDPSEATAALFAWEHRVTRVLGAIADGLVRDREIPRNPVVQALHDEPIDLGDAIVAVARFVPGSGSPLTAQRWGETLGLLHIIGSTDPALELLKSRPVTNALSGLTAEAFLAALDRPGHPFRNNEELVTAFAHTLRERTMYALQLDPEPILAHRDLHPLNCINAPEGGVAIDWQEAGWGNRSDDFSWIHVLVNRFGGSRKLLEDAKRAYDHVAQGLCPSDEQIEASGQQRELLCLGFSIQNAHRSPQHLAEAIAELPILKNRNARTGKWQTLFNPAIFEPGLVVKI